MGTECCDPNEEKIGESCKNKNFNDNYFLLFFVTFTTLLVSFTFNGVELLNGPSKTIKFTVPNVIITVDIKATDIEIMPSILVGFICHHITSPDSPQRISMIPVASTKRDQNHLKL